MSNYYEPYDEPFDTGEMDPYAMDDQAMVDFLVANGVGTGLLPQVQPSGKPMTTSNITGALSANRQGLFDTAFQGGMGGADAFAADAFVPTVTTTIRQEPELQQVYGYLRSPTSMEGIITQELMLGGTPATAQRALRQMLTATPEEMEAIFARYDQFFGRAPSMSAADAESIKTNLLLELPPARDEFGNPITEITPEGEGVDWNNSEDMSVFARANMINELNAQIPRIGPSGPKWGTDPTTGQPMQISAGGELQWSVDETGAPVMIEVTETPSAAKTVFDKLGLPDPSEEYTAESFMTPDQIAMQQAYGETEDPVAQLKAAWMDPALAPSNQGAGGPAGVPAAAGWGTGAPTREPLPAGSYVPPYARAEAEQAAQDPFYSQYPVLADPYVQIPELQPREALPFEESMQGWEPEPGHIFPGEPGFEEHEREHQGGQVPAAGQPAVPYPAGDPATYEEFVAQQGGALAPGQRDYTYGDWNQPAPGFGDNPLADALRGIVEAGQPAPSAPTPQMTNAMLAQIIGGGRQEPGYRQGDREQARQPGDTSQPGYQQGAGEAPRLPGGASYLEAIDTGEQRAAQRSEDEQQAQILGGSTDRTGKRMRPTRTGEQARQYRAAFDAWDAATDEQQRMKMQTYSGEHGRAMAQARNIRDAGIRPIDQAMMARRLVMMNAGMPQGI